MMTEMNGTILYQSRSRQHISILLATLIVIIISVRTVSSVSIEKDLSLSLREKRALDKLRERVTPLLYRDYMKTDLYLIRWLRATKFNVHDAEGLLKENLKWRKENKMDGIQSEDFSDMWQEYPATADTSDKQGKPIGTLDVYNWDLRQAALTGKGPRVLRYMDMLMDKGTQQVFDRLQKGMNVTQGVILVNVDGFSMVRHACPTCMRFFMQFVNSMETHFQGWIDELIIIEAPMTFQTVLNVVKPVLSEQTRNAMRVFSTDRKQWMEYLDERISREERRPAYGGTKV